MTKIVITTSSFGKEDVEVLNRLHSRGFTVVLNPYGRALQKNEILELCKDSCGIIAGTEKLDADTLECLARSADTKNTLKVISRCGTGLDNVNLDAANRLGISVFNTPDVPTLAVAELTVGLILDLLRKLSLMDRTIRNGKWSKLMGNLLCGKKVGIIGFGRIGNKVGELLSVFGTELAHCDVEPKECPFYCGPMKFEEILSWADIITIHVSASPQYRTIIGKHELQMMKRESYLVNVSRGGMVDEEALYHAIKDGHIAGAALDVFEKEPYVGSLTQLEQVILTPHIGSYAKEARIKMEQESVENLLKGLGVLGS